MGEVAGGEGREAYHLRWDGQIDYETARGRTKGLMAISTVFSGAE